VQPKTSLTPSRRTIEGGAPARHKSKRKAVALRHYNDGQILLVIERTEAHHSHLVAHGLGAAQSRQILERCVEKAPATDEGATGTCKPREGLLAMLIATGRGRATRLVWARAGEPGRRKGIAVDLVQLRLAA